MTDEYICNTIQLLDYTTTRTGGFLMDEPKLNISKRQYGGESVVTSLRLPKDMLKDIDDIAARNGRTRNELLIMCLEFAINHIEEN